jgi:hypothetical protein
MLAQALGQQLTRQRNHPAHPGRSAPFCYRNMFLAVMWPRKHIEQQSDPGSLQDWIAKLIWANRKFRNCASFGRKSYKTRRRRIAGDAVLGRLEGKYQAIGDVPRSSST